MKFKKFITALTVVSCIASCAPQPVYAGGFSSRSTSSVSRSAPVASKPSVAPARQAQPSKPIPTMGYQAKKADTVPVTQKPSVPNNVSRNNYVPSYTQRPVQTSPTYSNDYYRTQRREGHSTGTVLGAAAGAGLLGYMIGNHNTHQQAPVVINNGSGSPQIAPQSVSNGESTYPITQVQQAPVEAFGGSMLGGFLMFLVTLISWVLQIALIGAILFGLYRGGKWVWNKVKGSNYIAKGKEMFIPKTKMEKLVNQHYEIFSNVQNNCNKEDYHKALPHLDTSLVDVYTEHALSQEKSGSLIRKYRSDILGVDSNDIYNVRYQYELDLENYDEVFSYKYDEETGKFKLVGLTSYVDYIS